jgi:hypothetical protein
MFRRHQTTVNGTSLPIGSAHRVHGSSGAGQPPVDPARLREALAQACTVGLRERIGRPSLASPFASRPA